MKRFNWSRSLVILTFRNSSTRGRVLFNSPSRLHPDSTIINLCSLFKWSFGISVELLCVSVCLIPNEPTYPRESQRRVTAILEAVNFEQQHDHQPPLTWAKTSGELQTPLTSCKHFHLWTLVMWYCKRRWGVLVQSGSLNFKSLKETCQHCIRPHQLDHASSSHPSSSFAGFLSTTVSPDT